MGPDEKPLRVFVVCSTDNGAAGLRSLLAGEGAHEVILAKNGGEARRILLNERFDAAVVNAPLSDEFGDTLAMMLCGDALCETLLVVRGELYDEVCGRVEDAGVLTVAKPVSRAQFHQAFRLALASRRRADTLKRENRALLTRIDEIKLVERAKWALIGAGYTEAQAHRHIEKTAMDTRQTRADAAREILQKEHA
ncbi:MAG: ANTAR domain-containing protein [Oscillospiraceae bacterium]|nr:ANTAR domain-containing protein [Oscillospiraceae bacterium]